MDLLKNISMNKTILAASLISGFFMMSCGSSDSPEFDRSIAPADTAKAIATPVVNMDQPATVPANMQAPSTQPQAVQVQPQQVTTATPAPAATTAKGMNPPHGQPGHRCDIAVGAPLNSAPTAAKPQVTTSTSTPQVVSAPAATTAASATPTVTAPGMNPPHGQPGHDCAIAVGAPLKKPN
jgi:hypothetical protein